MFETAGVDESTLDNDKMKGIKRTVRRFGQCLGHQNGLQGSERLDYLAARKEIYLPSYRWVLDNCLQDEVSQLRKLAEPQTVVLLDYETNGDIDNLKKPLSHAWLVCKYVQGEWPS